MSHAKNFSHVSDEVTAENRSECFSKELLKFLTILNVSVRSVCNCRNFKLFTRKYLSLSTKAV